MSRPPGAATEYDQGGPRLIDYFLEGEIWENVVVLAAGGMEAHDVEVSRGVGGQGGGQEGVRVHLLQVRCQGAVEAARTLHSHLDFTGRLLSYEFATEEVAFQEESSPAPPRR